MDKEKLKLLAAHCQVLLRLHTFTERTWQIASVIIETSYALGQTECYLRPLEAFTRRTGIHRADVHRILLQLRAWRVIQADTRNGVYCFLPDPAHWNLRTEKQPLVRRDVDPAYYQLVLTEIYAVRDSLDGVIGELQRKTITNKFDQKNLVGDSPTSEQSVAPAPAAMGDSPSPTGATATLPPQSVGDSPTGVGNSPTKTHPVGNSPTATVGPAGSGCEIYINRKPENPGTAKPASNRSQGLEANRFGVGKSPTAVIDVDHWLRRIACCCGAEEVADMPRGNAGRWRVALTCRPAEAMTAIEAVEAMARRLEREGGRWTNSAAAYLNHCYENAVKRRAKPPGLSAPVHT